MLLLCRLHFGRHVQQFTCELGALLLCLFPLALRLGQLADLSLLGVRLFRLEFVDQLLFAGIVRLLSADCCGQLILAAAGGGQFLFGDGNGRFGGPADYALIILEQK